MLPPEIPTMLAPVELIELRFNALKKPDFALLYASYHPEALLLEQFPSAESYLEFAAEALSGMHVYQTDIGAQRETVGGLELICALSFELNGQRQTMYELALLLETAAGWRYHSAQKLNDADCPLGFETLRFSHFDQQTTMVRF